MESLIFNRANETDIPILSDILRDATERKVGYGDNVWGNDGWTDEEISDAMEKSTMYVVRKDDDIVGTISVQFEDEQMWGQQPEDAVYIHRLAVTSNYHGQGLGEAMIDWAATQATKEGRRVLRLDCEESNTQLCAYYEKNGFVQVGRKYIPEWNYWGALYEKAVETREDETEITHTPKKPAMSWQQRRLLDIHKLTPEFAHPVVEGLDNIELIPEGQPAIFVSTHRTESDMGLAIRTIGEQVPLIITDISTHDSFKGDVADKATFIARKILGGDGGFLPISFQRNGDEKSPVAFTPEDFSAMANAMTETGKNILIAAHNPKQEEATPGFGPAYLAMLTGAPLVPVASKPGIDKHTAHVAIGEPFYLDPIDVEPFKLVMEKRKRGGKLTQEDLIQFKNFTKLLREQGKIVFERVNSTLVRIYRG